MTLVPCPECQKDVSTGAAACPHCGRPQQRAAAPAAAHPPSTTPEQAKQQQAVKGCALGCLGILGLGLVMGVCVTKTGKAPAEKADPITAYVMCKGFVENRLKAPATAEFSGYGSSTVSRVSPNQFRVAGTVDAQNSFGAKIRNRFSCDLSYDPASDKWTASAVEVR